MTNNLAIQLPQLVFIGFPRNLDGLTEHRLVAADAQNDWTDARVSGLPVDQRSRLRGGEFGRFAFLFYRDRVERDESTPMPRPFNTDMRPYSIH